MTNLAWAVSAAVMMTTGAGAWIGTGGGLDADLECGGVGARVEGAARASHPHRGTARAEATSAGEAGRLAHETPGVWCDARERLARLWAHAEGEGRGSVERAHGHADGHDEGTCEDASHEHEPARRARAGARVHVEAHVHADL